MLPGKSGPSSHVWLKREVDGYQVMHSNTGEEVENSRASKGQLLPGVSTKVPPPHRIMCLMVITNQLLPVL